jgi:hypothetical protein
LSDTGAERAFLAIADVSGYTSYLAGVELDHAQDILSDLTVTVVEAMAPFQLLKLEGDAAFTYVPAESIDGSVLQDCIEGTYIAFRNRLRDISQASTCECNACTRIPDLDLKIVIHHGVIGRQRLMGLEELVGPDVILVHRLLKNEVVERTGVTAYALYTQDVLDAAGIDPLAQGLLVHREQTDIAAEVVAWVRDLDATWKRLADEPRRTIPAERRARSWVLESPAPPQFVFEFLTSPQRRLTWDSSIDSISEDSADGRRGTDTVNHCMHGKDAIIEQIVDWRPGQYWMTKTTFPGGTDAPQFVKSEHFSRTAEGGTRLELVIGSVEGRTLAEDEGVLGLVADNVEAGMPKILKAIAEAHAELAAGVEQPPELPQRRERFLSEPIAY